MNSICGGFPLLWGKMNAGSPCYILRVCNPKGRKLSLSRDPCFKIRESDTLGPLTKGTRQIWLLFSTYIFPVPNIYTHHRIKAIVHVTPWWPHHDLHTSSSLCSPFVPDLSTGKTPYSSFQTHLGPHLPQEEALAALQEASLLCLLCTVRVATSTVSPAPPRH